MRKIKLLVPIILILFVMACASDTPWRRATVSTFELAGDAVAISKDTTIVLYSQHILTDVQLAKAKDLYNKAQKIYVTMGDILKAAGRTESAVERDQLLSQYNSLLADFKSISNEIFQLVNSLKP
jgi:hypothetical protein